MIPVINLFGALLLAVALLVPAVTAAGSHAAPAVVADKGEEGSEGEDDGNRGHGNDPDGVDEDNPSNSTGNENKGNNKKNDKPGKEEPVEAVAPYSVDVACDFDEDAAETFCTFTGVAPEGAADVGHIVVVGTDVCAEVIGGDHEAVDPDPTTRVSGYKSTGAEGTLTLQLSGEVTIDGAAIYWVKSGEGVFPAEGPGLSCDLPAAASDSTEPVEATFDTTPDTGTGSLAVRAYRCTDVPADPTGFDWFGSCDPAGAGLPFSVAPSGEDTPTEGETGADGAVTFDGLAPGAYTVDLIDGSWCHAKSDRVDANSEVSVKSGTTSTVWIFTCGEEPSGA